MRRAAFTCFAAIAVAGTIGVACFSPPARVGEPDLDAATGGSGGSGEARGSGGAGTGGDATGTGGVTGTGGNVAGTGGVTGTGGDAAGTGGAIGTGGAGIGTGGVRGTGGASGTGGGVGTGGIGTGGVRGTGGANGTGGAGTGGTGTGGAAGGAGGPCDGLCDSPRTLTPTGSSASFDSGDLGTGASCFETTAQINGGGCSNFTPPRTLTVNDTVESCTTTSFTIPAKRNGGYCFLVSAGLPSYAAFFVY